MIKRILFLLVLLLVLLSSAGSIQASDVNGTDVASVNFSEDMNLQINGDDNLSDDLAIIDDALGENAKNQTELTTPTTKMYYNGTYDVTLIDSNRNESLAYLGVIFSINGIEYYANTDSNGVASINLKLNPGTYSASAYFPGDDNFYPSNNLSGEFKVLTTIKASDVTKYYKGSKNYQATFLDSQGSPLKNKSVTITLNGKKYTRKTDVNGVATLAVNLKPGTYKVSATNPVTGEQSTTSFRILTTLTASDINKVRGDGRKFTAKFLKSNGKALANQYIKIKINGKTHKVKTNSNGKASLSLDNLKKGTYKVISYNNDGLSATNTVRIYNSATTKLATSSYTFLPNDTKTITVKLTTSLNDDSNSGKTVTIKIGDKTYYKKTDSKGIAKLDVKSVKKGIYTVEYSYSGTKFIKSSKSKNQLTIFDTNQSSLSIKGTSSFGYGAGTSLKVCLTAGGVVLSKRTVTFVIEGVMYTRTTDNDGIASVPIDLKIGKYTIDVQAEAKFRIAGTSKSFSIDVFQRAPSKLTWKSGISYKDSSQSFKVLLTNSDGKAISGGKIGLTIDGETYSGKTDSNGYATIKTSVALGKYDVSVEFFGSNDYLPSSTSKAINVELSTFKGGVNERNTISSLSAYLKSTKNCQVNNAKIKSLVNSLTKGLTDDIDKAKAIFNYVRDNIVYDYYYNSHKGAVSTLKAGSANCADQAHLLVCMYRTAGFKARYVHGTCVFSDGTFGHVWTQVLIGKYWVVGDSISYKNSLGKIKNWKVNSYRLHSRYLSLPF